FTSPPSPLEPPPPRVSSIEEISASIEGPREAVDTNGDSPLSRLCFTDIKYVFPFLFYFCG
ncbi:MAG TPA: hypothetical protein VGO47_08520, partial [Chlamydiales bacterium]|nr:hypothetical protein [Chlamydiales bacterium]